MGTHRTRHDGRAHGACREAERLLMSMAGTGSARVSWSCARPPPPAANTAPAQPQQAYAEPVPPPQTSAAPAQTTDMSERLAQLKQHGELLSASVLTQAEFEQQKTRILNG
jgi:hypothetical protein